MKVVERIQILKFFLLAFNALFVILGVAIFGCGVWILFDKNNFIVTVSNGQSMRIIAGGLFVIGLVVVTVSAIGYLGALKEVRFLLVMYMSLLIIIFLGQVFITFILLLKENEITRTLSDEVDKIIIEYGNETEQSKGKHTWDLIDTMQHYWQCCGRTNYTEWKENTYIKNLGESDVYPCTCFNRSTCPLLATGATQRFGHGSEVYDMGCQTRMEDWILQNALVILGMDLGLALIQVIQFTLCLYLFRNVLRKMKEKRNMDNSSTASSTPRSSLTDERPLYH
ncbi:putative tetraspanin-19 [Scleropages formosus]|uniref:putative tetraspanin-19 n=1 Tax=Scleropages formosus TaxID=113540 RepID=UPI0010FA68BD|nr:putative tetraspanin-19 [Scleropages formosus]